MAMLTRLTSSGTTTVTPGSPKGLQRFQNYLSAFLWPGTQRQRRKSTQLDAIDCFTNDLVTRKTQKWEELRDSLMKRPTAAQETDANSNVALGAGKSGTTSTSFSQNVGLMSKGMMNDLKALRSPQLGLDIRSLSQPQLDNLLMATLEIKNKLDFLYLIRQCIRCNLLPSNEVFVSCLKYLSAQRKLQQIEALAETCRQLEHPFSQTYADLAPFRAIALWNNGNADVALMTLHRGYGVSMNSEEGRKMARTAFRTISEETLAQKSEAVLVSLLEVARAIHREHKDIFVVACVWKQCFVSDWFCDQKSAGELFEHYKDLQELVERRAGPLCTSFLGRNNVDAVHRLIEVFLQHKQRSACSSCLSLLFNYQYMRKDLRACAEIVKSCSELEMPLNELQNEQFLSLFLDQSDPLESNGTSGAISKYKAPKSFQYKF
ncbi:uncharacterized protein Dana_GF12446 [Drosophila ananassae]|uniref:Uncharacterized protein n=1 Tax=Drosophila ananassae TaxID=7217 RepID=B3MEN9_DROAN|nr:uncharacterized protein LOC6495296 [Drosophila ananassae]EDV35503.1 uncharacterized protein Dana_GF12446 [Drosophila ananassae]KAH8321877.1 hypothetical protein KR067_007584 [Drosophila pandora]